MNSVNTSDNYVISPPKVVYITFGIFCCFFNVLFLLVYLKNNTWGPLSVTVVISLYIFYYIKSHRITIKDGLCSISKPFVSMYTIPLQDLLYINVIPAFKEKGSRLKSPFSIALGFDLNGKKEEIELNAKMFGVKNIDMFSATIEKVNLKKK